MNERDKVIWSEAAKATEGAGDSWDAQVAFMQEFADLIRADEREDCAKVCDVLADVHEKANQWGSHKTADALAQAIRARGNT